MERAKYELAYILKGIRSGFVGNRCSSFKLRFAPFVWRLRERLRPVGRGDVDAVVLTTESGRRCGGTECARRRDVAVAERSLDDAGQNHLRDGARTRV